MKKLSLILTVIFCVFLIVSCSTLPQDIPEDNCEHDLVSVLPKFPTCSENGYTSHQKCTKCNYSTKVEALANGVHEFDKSGVCRICGISKGGTSELKEEISYYTYVQQTIIISGNTTSLLRTVPYTGGICTGEINYHKSYFDDNGLCLKKDNYSLFDRLLSTEIFFYDENGNEIFSKFIDPKADYTGIDPSAYLETHHQRNDDGSYSETSYSYDMEGQVVEENYSFYNADGVCLTDTVKIIKNDMFQNIIMTYKFDMKGNLISYQLSDIAGDFSSLTQYTYDKNDNLTLVTLDGDVILENTYNEDGFISLKIEKENGEIINQTTYDSYGNITAIYPMNLSDPSITYENEYSNGDLVSKTITHYSKDGNQTSKTEFEYERDTNGELIRYKIINYSYENDEFVFNNYTEYYDDGTYSAKNLVSYTENARKTNENGTTKIVCKKEQRINHDIIWMERLYTDKYLLEWQIDYDSDGNISSKEHYEYNEDRQKIKKTVYDANGNVVDEIEFTYGEA